MNAELHADGAGRWRLKGALRFDTVPALLERQGDFPGAEKVVLDLSGVGEFDTSALALLLEWRRRARSAGGSLGIENLPERLHDLARVGGVDEILLG
jgi:phospholipid transport system transporter-binding protein